MITHPGWGMKFLCGLIVMVALNLLRLLNTWRAYGTDGFEQIGFPFVFFERGGFSYQEIWYYHWPVADICIVLGGAAYAAYVLRDGWINAFRQFQTWGLDDVEGSQPKRDDDRDRNRVRTAITDRPPHTT